MECVFCKINNRDNAVFCKGCGKPIELKCLHCQKSIPLDSRFCDNCGASIRPMGDTNSDPEAKKVAMVEWIRQILNQNKAENLFEFCTDKVSAILIKEVLETTKGNRSKAARLLGLSRPTLHSKIDKYSIE